jgi:uncharacterized membrane protein (DUF2068 family)
VISASIFQPAPFIFLNICRNFGIWLAHDWSQKRPVISASIFEPARVCVFNMYLNFGRSLIVKEREWAGIAALKKQKTQQSAASIFGGGGIAIEVHQ